MKLSDLKPNEDNPRNIETEKLQKLKKSIEEFPKMMELRPIIIDADNVILAGNMRYLALKELGRKVIPKEWVKRAEALTEDEKRRFIIVDNVGFGEWDWELLKGQWNVEELGDWGMDTDPWKLDDSGNANDDEFTIPDVVETDITPGDLFELKGVDGQFHKVYCGDSTDLEAIEKLMGNRKADLIVTDPPYNVDYTGKTKDALKIDNDDKNDEDFYKFLYDAFVNLLYSAKNGCPIYIFHADSEGMNFRKALAEAQWKFTQCLIWVKQTMVMGRQDYQWQHEPILYGWKPGTKHKWYSDRKQTTILNFDRPTKSKEHPTMKPIELLSYMVKNSSRSEDLIVDTFGGSGSTMVTGHQLIRSVYIMEIDPKYCDVIIQRMARLDSTIIITKNGKVETKKWLDKVKEAKKV